MWVLLTALSTISIFLLCVYFFSFYHETETGIETRAFPTAAIRASYPELKSLTFVRIGHTYNVFIESPDGKKRGVNINNYRTPLLYAYYLTEAARSLDSEQLEADIKHLQISFREPLTPSDLKILRDINERSGR